MRGRDMPLAKRGGLIDFGTQMDAQRHFAQARGKIKIGGRGIGWIAFDNNQRRHRAPHHILRQFAQRSELVDRVGLHRFGVHDRLSDVA